MRIAIMTVAIALAAVGAQAAHTWSAGAGYSCNSNGVSLGGHGRAYCGGATGGRYLFQNLDSFWGAGLDYSYYSFADNLGTNRRGGDLSAAQIIFQHDFLTGTARPYMQLGGGLGWTPRHGSSQPVDLAVSGALGVDVGTEGFVAAFEVRALYARLEGIEVGQPEAIVVTPTIRAGWRFK